MSNSVEVDPVGGADLRGNDVKVDSRRSTIRVLVVDDSTFFRHVISNMLGKSSEIQIVGTARSGEEAIQKVLELKPDVMTLDLDMPGMNGLQVLERIMPRHPLPVVVVSSLTEAGAKETLRALELGAVDFLPKHLNGSVLSISNIENQLLKKVKASARAMNKIGLCFQGGPTGTGSITHTIPQPVPAHRNRVLHGDVTRPHTTHEVRRSGTKLNPPDLVMIGCSTGGPKVLQDILPQVPHSIRAAVLIVQHMPQFFTKPFAERLDQLCQLSVHEAVDGELLEGGVVLVAPGGQHLRVERDHMGQVCIRISEAPHHLPYRPSVDIAMESAAPIYGSHLLGVVLTGMGNDGLLGARAIRTHRGRIVVQDEATSIVYGMPKAVIEAGYADAVVPTSGLAQELMRVLRSFNEESTDEIRTSTPKVS